MFCGSDRVLSALLTGRVWYPRADVLQYKERVGVCLKRQHGGRQRADPGVLLPARLPDQLQPNPARSAFWILCVPNVRKWKQKNVKWLIQTSLPCLLFFVLFVLFLRGQNVYCMSSVIYATYNQQSLYQMYLASKGLDLFCLLCCLHHGIHSTRCWPCWKHQILTWSCCTIVCCPSCSGDVWLQSVCPHTPNCYHVIGFLHICINKQLNRYI